MSAYSLFTNIIMHAFQDNVSDAEYAKVRETLSEQIRYNVKIYDQRSAPIDNGIQVNLSMPTSEVTTQKYYMMIRCRGTAELTIVGTDNLGAAITPRLPMYGTALFPGYVMLLTYQVTSCLVTSKANGTVVDWVNAVVEDDA